MVKSKGKPVAAFKAYWAEEVFPSTMAKVELFSPVWHFALLHWEWPVAQDRPMLWWGSNALPWLFASAGSQQYVWTGTSLGQVTSYISVFTDAYLMGWWGTCLGRAICILWPLGENCYINLIKLQAMLLVLQHYINRQGRVQSAVLLRLVENPLL